MLNNFLVFNFHMDKNGFTSNSNNYYILIVTPYYYHVQMCFEKTIFTIKATTQNILGYLPMIKSKWLNATLQQ